MGLEADDPESQARLAAFAQGLQQAGWTVGQNIRIDYRWGAGNADTMRKHAARAGRARARRHPGPFQRGRRAAAAGEPDDPDRVHAGRRSGRRRLRRQPGAPGRQRHRLHQLRIFDRRQMARAAQGDRAERDACRGASGICSSRPGPDSSARSRRRRSGSASSCARSICGMPTRSSAISWHSPAGSARRPDRDWQPGGDGPSRPDQRAGAPPPAARRSSTPAFTSLNGGLISYGPDFVDQFRRAAGYVDRILRGENPADLPVQAADQISNSSSISKLPKNWASSFRPSCSPAPTKPSNDFGVTILRRSHRTASEPFGDVAIIVERVRWPWTSTF